MVNNYWFSVANIVVICAYIRTFSFAKIWNIVKLRISYVLSVTKRKASVWGNPMALSIEPINVCNLKCPECPTGMGVLTRPKGMVSLSDYRLILKHLHRSLWHVNLYFQGEPYMHPDFFSLVSLAKKRKLVVETSTNAQYLNYGNALETVKSGLDILVVSMDGTTQEVYEKYRIGGRLDKVLEGLKNIATAKKELKSLKPVVRVQFLAFGFNEHQVTDFEKMALTYGANQVEVKQAQVYEVEKKVDLLPNDKSLSRYGLCEHGAVRLRGKVKNSCWKHWSSAVVTWDGKVVPCCFDKNAGYVMGDLLQACMANIWKTKRFSSFRTRVLTAQESIDICGNCPFSKR